MKLYQQLAMIILAALLAGCSAGSSGRVRLPATATPSAAPEPALAAQPKLAGTGRTILPEVGLRLVAGYLSEPTYLTHAGDGSGRLFVLERRGKIRLIEQGRLRAGSFLDLSGLVNADNDLEQGLLGLAFHPNFPADPRFFVYYSNRDDDTVLASYRVNGAGQPEPDSAQTLLLISQPFTNHNGGQLLFGPDGYLYLGVGEGGLSEDPGPNSLLGKILRLDVDGAEPYAIPPDNPFVGDANYRPEIWDLGLRNPWRFSFDRQSGDLYIADVGQNLYEEVNLEPAGSGGGRNYGWPIMEGYHCYESAACNQSGLTLPVAEYERKEGCAITGGYVYRGAQFPQLDGLYFFGDYCTGKIWAMPPDDAPVEALDTILNISSFGQDEAGELYVTDLSTGQVYQLVVTARETNTNWPGAWPLAETLEVRLDTQFEGGIRLAGYQADSPLDSPGEVVQLTLFWQGQRLPETGNVFVQVRDASNTTVAQADHPLYVSQDVLTADGTMLRDGAALVLPPDLPAGEYRLLAGFYNAETGQRLPVINDQSGENAAVLGAFLVGSN